MHVEQFVNGDDADVAPGPTLLVDDRISWTYTVTNFGNLPLHGVVLVDTLGLKPVLVGGDRGRSAGSGRDMDVPSREQSRGRAAEQRGDRHRARPLRQPVVDDDPSFYSGVRRAVIGDIVWNDGDGNAAPGPNETGIPGADVVITNRATGDRQTVTTDATCAYPSRSSPEMTR